MTVASGAKLLLPYVCGLYLISFVLDWLGLFLSLLPFPFFVLCLPLPLPDLLLDGVPLPPLLTLIAVIFCDFVGLSCGLPVVLPDLNRCF